MSRELGMFTVADSSEKLFVDKLNQIFYGAITVGASDIHFEDAENGIRIRYRCDGQLEEVDVLDHRLKMQIDQKIRLKASIPITERNLPQDGKIFFIYDGRRVDVRINICPTIYGQSIVCRLLDSDDSNRDINNIQMSSSVRETLLNILNSEHLLS